MAQLYKSSSWSVKWELHICEMEIGNQEKVYKSYLPEQFKVFIFSIIFIFTIISIFTVIFIYTIIFITLLTTVITSYCIICRTSA